MAAPVIEQTGPQVVVHQESVAAPAALCFDLVAQVESAPQFFGSHLHAEVTCTDATDAKETVERWALVPGGGIRHWTADRFVDAAARRVVFAHTGGRPPVVGMRGEWSFTPEGDGTTFVRLEHALTFAEGTSDQDVQAALGDIDRGGRAQLAQLREVAESYAQLSARTVHAAARTVVPGAHLPALHERLAEAARAEDGWAVASVPARRLVLKLTAGLPARLHAATARVDLAPTAGGVEVTVLARVTSAASGPPPAALHRWLTRVLAGKLGRIAAVR